MDRRQFIYRSGTVAAPITLGLAGCSDGEADADDGAEDGSDDEEGDADATPTATATQTPAGSLSIASESTDSVQELGAVLHTVTVANDGASTRSGEILATVEVDDREYSNRRPVTVPGGEETTVPIKVSHDSGQDVNVFVGSATISDDTPGAYDGSLDPSPAELLVVTDASSDSVDDTQAVLFSVTVRNIAAAARSATLVAEVDLEDGGAFTEQSQVNVPGGATREYSLTVSYDSDDAFVYYTTDAWIE